MSSPRLAMITYLIIASQCRLSNFQVMNRGLVCISHLDTAPNCFPFAFYLFLVSLGLKHADFSSTRERCNSYIWGKSRYVILEVQFPWGYKLNLYEAWLFLSLRAAHLKVCIIYEIAASSRISTSKCILHSSHTGVCRLLKADSTCKIWQHFNTFSVH